MFCIEKPHTVSAACWAKGENKLLTDMWEHFLVWKIKQCFAFHLFYTLTGFMRGMTLCLTRIQDGSDNVWLSLTLFPLRIIDRVVSSCFLRNRKPTITYRSVLNSWNNQIRLEFVTRSRVVSLFSYLPNIKREKLCCYSEAIQNLMCLRTMQYYF